jgi:preprotein translocase subunit SecA
MVRKDQSDLIYKTQEAKFLAVADDIKERNEAGQPVLVGTTSVERSEYLSRILQKLRVPHNVLNAKNHELEAAIVAEAGRRGAVTVATNMAGRGTDIVLGGNVDFILDQRLRERGLDPVETPEDYEQAWHEELPKVKAKASAEAEEVIATGGLYVLGTERHESRRIDNQLRGRSGRQGDPGESRFYLSLDDELMRRFNGAALESLLTRLNLPDDVPIEAKMVTRAIKSAQTQVEQQNFEIRKNVLKYDEVMNQQRKVIYAERRLILEGEDLQPQVHEMLVDVVTAYVNGAAAEGYAEDWDLESLWGALKTLYPVGVDYHELIDSDAVGEEGDLTREELLDLLVTDARKAYAKREADVDALAGEGAMRQLERNILLNVLDRKWREHLYEMDYLKEGIGLRAMAQRDPLVEYQREGYDMFTGMLDALKEESIGFLFNVQVEPAPQTTVAPVAAPAGLAALGRDDAEPTVRAKGINDQDDSRPLTYVGPAEDGGVEVKHADGAGRPKAAGGSRRERREAKRQQSKGGRGILRRG